MHPCAAGFYSVSRRIGSGKKANRIYGGSSRPFRLKSQHHVSLRGIKIVKPKNHIRITCGNLIINRDDSILCGRTGSPWLQLILRF